MAETQYIVKLGTNGNEVLKNDESDMLEASSHIKLLEYSGNFNVSSLHLWVD